MIDFMMRFGAIQSELASLLDEKFVPGESNSQIGDYLYDTQTRILKYHNNGDYAQRDYHLLRLQMFQKHLNEIEENDPDLLNEFREELKKEEYENYYGTRFEIDIAASLLRKEILFHHPDPPDFVIDSPGELIIECTTSHLSGGDRTIEEKFKQSIIAKSNKPYFQSNAALFVDITNLIYHAVDGDVQISESLVKEWVRESIENFSLEIGSIVIFVYLVETEDDSPKLAHKYWRIDNENADDLLIEALDEFYPYGDSSVEKPYHPHDP